MLSMLLYVVTFMRGPPEIPDVKWPERYHVLAASIGLRIAYIPGKLFLFELLFLGVRYLFREDSRMNRWVVVVGVD